MSRQRAMRVRPRAEFRCGHPKTAENSAKSGYDSAECRMCKNARHAAWMANQKPAVLPPRQPLDLSGDQAVQLYRAEVARRKNRPNVTITAAKADFDRHLQAQRDARKGGRPPTHRTFGKKQAIPDLSESLGQFGGEGP